MGAGKEEVKAGESEREKRINDLMGLDKEREKKVYRGKGDDGYKDSSTGTRHFNFQAKTRPARVPSRMLPVPGRAVEPRCIVRCESLKENGGTFWRSSPALCAAQNGNWRERGPAESNRASRPSGDPWC